MSLSTYQLVVAIAEYGNMTRAAESLHITPSAASHAISALEDSFGFPIFHRGRSGATLTPLGQSLLPRIRTILSEEAHLQEEISKIMDSMTAQYILVYSILSAPTGCPPFFAPFRRNILTFRSEFFKIVILPLKKNCWKVHWI